MMERVIRVFDGFEAAEKAEDAEYAAMTPQQRLDILLRMIDRYREELGEAASRFERVCRVTRRTRR